MRRCAKLTRYISTACFLCFVVICGLLTVVPVRAQTTEANLAGIVYDQNHAVIPGAKVDLIDRARGITKTAMTNGAGAYQFAFVQPGTYDLNVSMNGFKSLQQAGLILSSAQNARVDLTLEVGGVTQTVEVNASETAALDTASAERNDVIGAQKAEELPLNGRDFTTLPLLSPGVTPDSQGSGNAKRGGFDVSGSGDQSNYFILNGLDDNDAVTVTPLFHPSVDAIGEMTVLTGQYQAQYGFLGGGQVVMTVKAGTNQFHGSVYEFIRNNAVITAKNYFSTSVPYYNRNQYGATIGGPLIKDKTFFFAAYEGLNSKQSIPITSTVPTAAMDSGDFSALLPAVTIINPNTGTAFSGNKINIPLSPIGQALLALYPAPTSPSSGAPGNNFFWNPIRPEQDNTYSARIDQTFSSKDTAFISGNLYGQNAHLPIGQTGCNGGSQLPNLGCKLTYHGDVYGLSETHVFSQSLVNQAYSGLSVGYQPYEADGTHIDFWGQLGYHYRTSMPDGLPATGIPSTSMTGYTSLAAGSQYRRDPRTQITDTLSWTRGRHGITLGYHWSNLPATYVRNIPPSGSLAFSNTSAGPTTGYAVADVLLGLPSSTTFVSSALEARFLETSTAAFIQDNSKVSSRLSLNLGLRWEITPPLRERSNFMNSFDPVAGIPVTPGVDGYGNTMYNTDWLDFAPRLGFSWQPFSDSGKTVLRGGFGTYFNRLPVGNQSFLIWGQYPYVTSSTYTSSKAQPVTLTNPFPSGNAVTTISINGVSKDLPTPRTYQWSLGIQRELPARLVADVAFAGSTSVDQFISTDINQASPGAGTPAQVNARRPYPSYGAITFYSDSGSARYESLQSKLSRRFDHGVSFTAAYTYAHSIDNTQSRTNQYDPSTGYGSSSFDIRHRFVLSGVFDLPFGKDRPWLSKGIASRIVGGWQVTPIFQTQTGQPLTATLSGNFSNSGGDASDRPNLVGNPNQGAPHTPQQWFNTSAFQVPIASGKTGATYTFGNESVGVIRGPGITNFDASLVRNFKIHEKITAQIRMQVFNVFNHPIWGLPALAATTPSTFGTITSTNIDNRESEFAAKVSF